MHGHLQSKDIFQFVGMMQESSTFAAAVLMSTNHLLAIGLHMS